eukprot:5087739-Prymnesium_polylepis.1
MRLRGRDARGVPVPGGPPFPFRRHPMVYVLTGCRVTAECEWADVCAFAITVTAELRVRACVFVDDRRCCGRQDRSESWVSRRRRRVAPESVIPDVISACDSPYTAIGYNDPSFSRYHNQWAYRCIIYPDQ